ncbi:MAG: S8 family serine peptidase [Acidimicrobiia bacterium]|nr:S8 family serine peptidase [Acidimicrobiia bacterium]
MDSERHPADPTVAFGRRPDGTEYLYVPGELITDAEDDRSATRLEGLGAVERTDDPPPLPDRHIIGAHRSSYLPRHDPDGRPLTWRPESDPDLAHRGLARIDRANQPVAAPALGDLSKRRWYLPDGADTVEMMHRLRKEKKRVQPNHVYALQPWWFGHPGNLPRPDAAFGPPPSGKAALDVTVLDTGIRSGWLEDDWFASRVEAGADDEELLDTDADGCRDAQAGHGTFITGVIANRAPNVRVRARRLLSSVGLTSDVLLAIKIHELIETIGSGVLSLSLGGYTFDDRPPRLLSAALRLLHRDAVVVAAAGNNSSNRPFYPAAMEEVVAVGSICDGDNPTRSQFSNFGDWVDCYAHGEDVHSTMIIHSGPVVGSPDPDDFDGYARWSGTSFAAPRVAAAIAQTVADEGIKPRDAFVKLLTSAQTLAAEGSIIV